MSAEVKLISWCLLPKCFTNVFINIFEQSFINIWHLYYPILHPNVIQLQNTPQMGQKWNPAWYIWLWQKENEIRNFCCLNDIQTNSNMREALRKFACGDNRRHYLLRNQVTGAGFYSLHTSQRWILNFLAPPHAFLTWTCDWNATFYTAIYPFA